MKRHYLFLIICLMGIWQTGQSQVLRSMTPRYNNPSVKGNIIFVANNIITTSGTITTEAPPAGSATNNGNVGVNLDVDAIPSTTYFTYGASWKYLANNTRPASWETVAFADGAWPAGNAELGYGDGDETTVVSYGADPNNKYITTYFRKSVNIPNPATHSNFTLNVKRDDGVAVYVNGVEVFRDNLPAVVLAHGTLATAAAADDGEAILPVTLPTTAFMAGNNVIAVEMHQNAINSSDLSFDMELVGNPISTVSLLPFGANWKYLDNNTRPAGWETTGFSDAAWAAGNAELGYGDGGEATVVSYGPDAANKYITTYFRKVVNIANPSTYASIMLNLVRDDGAVVYVNGVEVVRSNMPAGAIAHSTLAASNISGAAETAINTFPISTSYFVNGNNTIAVEVHQDVVNSSDISFNMELIGSLDPTFNSSSADLTLPSCSQVLFAGLYWGATQGTDGTNTTWISNETAIKLKIPGSATYSDITSTQTDYHNNTLVPGLPHTGYRCFADITSLINATNANGTYTVANVCSPAGINNTAAGWTIVIAYSDPGTIVRNLTVYDGSVIMNGGDPALHIPITGFLTPPTGPVDCELGAVVFDGDRGSQDEFSFKQNSNPAIGSYTNLTANATANLNDMWNSTISAYGSVVTTRSPAHNNTLGYDADIIDVPNAGNSVLGNSQNSASIRFSSPSENYMLQVATTAISQFTPTFTVAKTSLDVNGGALNPGDAVRYEIAYRNRGNDASTGTTVIDNIPAGTSYVPNSLQINGSAKTDAAGDDEAEYDYINNRVIFRIGTGANSTTGGEINPNGNGNVRFRVYTPTSCALFVCNNTISNRARMSYNGKLSLLSLEDSSGVDVAGCLLPDPVSNIITGTCMPLGDTILTNICPVLTATIPVARYAGYRFFSGMPFTPATLYNPATPVSFTRIIYAYYDGPGSCDDTLRINVFITSCPDLDDDNDGIPDYVEINNPLATGNHDADAFLNWNDATYPGYVDNNSDGFNDNFDPSADSDNNGIPNFYDPAFPGWADSNGDGVNDTMDKDLDGIPNHLDLDSDNDGIPDVTESFGVDANGDGRIDNYSDTDNDGLSQNVDANNTGVNNSGLALGPLDTDGDGVPNYLDLDSDNDGIPDIIEAYGTDASNSARVSVFTDTDGDGYADTLDGDVGNDAVAENAPAALLKTGADGDNNGRCDTWPNNNMDADSKPNPYDLDSDGDGITDVIEAGFLDGDWNGRVDGAINANGRNILLAALGTLSLPNSDANGRVNMNDIDSDDDGIPDNIEGLTTNGYLLPSGNDSDGDGIDNAYDNFSGFGGDGIHVVDTDSDSTPDYLDSDTDSDGSIDRIEGNDLNLNGLPDDVVTLTGIDTDGDGLDNRFDNNNSAAEVTSARMGNGGTVTGDPTPGSVTTVQNTVFLYGCPTERDWRCLPYILSCEFVSFKAVLNNKRVQLDWSALCRQEISHFIVERSTDRVHFTQAFVTAGKPVLNEVESYTGTDDINGLDNEMIYYRLKSIMKSGRELVSNIIAVRQGNGTAAGIKVLPNPVKDLLQISLQVQQNTIAGILIMDASGRILYRFSENLLRGSNTLAYTEAATLPEGMYFIRVELEGKQLISKFNKLK